MCELFLLVDIFALRKRHGRRKSTRVKVQHTSLSALRYSKNMCTDMWVDMCTEQSVQHTVKMKKNENTRIARARNIEKYLKFYL